MQAPKLSLTDFASDPDGFIRRARSAGCPFAETDTGPLALSHEAVLSLVQSKQTRPSFSTVLQLWGITSGAFYDWMSRSPLDMDGEAHRAWRRLMARTFTPQSVEKLRPRVRAEAQALVERFASRGQCEFVSAFARILPSFGLCELIGVPTEDRAIFGEWADTIGLGFNMMLAVPRIADVDRAIVSLIDYSGKLVEARRRDPRDDFISRLIQAVDETRTIDTDLLKGTIAGLVFAGHETTKNQLAWMIVILNENPTEWDRAHAEPGRAPAIVEEVLRFRSTATSVARIALDEVEIAGHTFDAGTSFIGSLWAANRDPAEFKSPMEFDVDANRDGIHVAFGQGPHHCLGAALARLELQEALVALAARITCPKVEEGATFTPAIGINGPTKLPISFSRR